MKAPKCKLCGLEHWGLCGDHAAKGSLFGRDGAHSVGEGARLSAKRPAPSPVSTIVTSPGGVTARVHGDKPLTPAARDAIGAVIDAAAAALEASPANSERRRRAADVLADVTARTSKPKPKRKRRMDPKPKKPAKDGTKRGRNPTGFDKRAYDRERAAARRAAKKATDEAAK